MTAVTYAPSQKWKKQNTARDRHIQRYHIRTKQMLDREISLFHPIPNSNVNF
jgi:hypothetical protein